jgi:AraC family transcriptional regulator of adaptative response/methylated-DNA-[protein]-cysteine methyltransferase
VEWCGVSPKKFLQYLNVNVLKEKLSQGQSVFDAALDTGLSGTGRAHDLFVTIEGVSPGVYKNNYKGISMYYGFHESPFGTCMVASVDQKLCRFDFIIDESDSTSQLKNEFKGATLIRDQHETQIFVNRIFSNGDSKAKDRISLWLKGTPFQLKVWEALLKIPEGFLASYDMIAAAIGQPGASRAVGSAIGKNPIAYLIPCHRVIRKEGKIGHYRWGTPRKMAILGFEASVNNTTA